MENQSKSTWLLWGVKDIIIYKTVCKTTVHFKQLASQECNPIVPELWLSVSHVGGQGWQQTEKRVELNVNLMGNFRTIWVVLRIAFKSHQRFERTFFWREGREETPTQNWLNIWWKFNDL